MVERLLHDPVHGRLKPRGEGAAVHVAPKLHPHVGAPQSGNKILDVIDARGGTEIDERVVGADDADGVARFGQSVVGELIDLGQGVTRAGGVGAQFRRPARA